MKFESPITKESCLFHQNVLNIHMFQIDLEWQNRSARAPNKDWAPLRFLKNNEFYSFSFLKPLFMSIVLCLISVSN